MDCSLPGSSVHGDSPGKNTAVGCHALLQGIFLTQGLNSGLLHCRQIFCHLSYREGLPWWLRCGIIPPPPPKVYYPLFSWVHFLFEHLHKSPNTLLHLDWLSSFPSHKILVSNLKDGSIKPSMPNPSQQEPLFPLASINCCLHFILKILVVSSLLPQLYFKLLKSKDDFSVRLYYYPQNIHCLLSGRIILVCPSWEVLLHDWL